MRCLPYLQGPMGREEAGLLDSKKQAQQLGWPIRQQLATLATLYDCERVTGPPIHHAPTPPAEP